MSVTRADLRIAHKNCEATSVPMSHVCHQSSAFWRIHRIGADVIRGCTRLSIIVDRGLNGSRKPSRDENC